MKTSVKKMMMSFALIGCLVIGASDASAQGRSRSQGGSTASRSQSAAVSSSSKSTAPSVSRVGSASSGSRSTSTPQVSRPSSATSVSRSASTPQVSRSSSSTSQVSRSTSSTPQVGRTDHSRPSTVGTSGSSKPNTGSITGRSATTRPSTGSSIGSGHSSSTTTPQVGRTDQSRPSTVGISGSSKPNTGSVTGRGATTRPGSGSSSGSGTTVGISKKATDNVKHQSDLTDKRATTDVSREQGTSLSTKPNFGKKPGDGGGKPGNGGKPDNGGKPGNGGGKPDHGGGKPDHGGGKPHDHGGNHGYNPKHPYDYKQHHYRDEFRLNHMHHDWTRPLPPPARPYRPAPWVWVRPTIPVGWHPYVGAPVIDRILGLVFGTLYDVSLDYLYYNGYYIDGYADGIIYLRDVPMLNLYWPDVMLNYEYNQLVNAQFIYHNSYYSTSRFDKAYRSLSRIYGPPVYHDGMTVSWYGGNSRGYVTLSLVNSYGDYYTTLSIGY